MPEEATATFSPTMTDLVFDLTITRLATTLSHNGSTFNVPASVFTATQLEAQQVGSNLSLPSTTIELPTVIATPAGNEGSPGSDNDCSGSFSSAEAAGIGIGAAVGGIALATAAIALYLHFKRKPRLLPLVKASRASRPIDRTHFGTLASNDRFAGSQRNAVDELPQRRGDNEYLQQVERLKTGIKNCVENFFDTPHALEDEHKAHIEKLVESNPNVSNLVDGLSSRNSYKRCCAIRALFAQLIFDRIDPRAEALTPLLPPALFSLYRSLRTGSAQVGRMRSRSIGIESDRHELIQTWRQITGAYMPRDLLRKQARLAVEGMALSLAPLCPSSPEDFEEVLHDLGIQAARLGLALFTIPEQWSPVWAPAAPQPNRHLVVFPGVQLLGQGNESTRRLTDAYLE